MVHAVKNGYTYVLNRATGALVSAYPFADYITWNKGLDKNGAPIDRLQLSKEHLVFLCPALLGARGAASHDTYSPRTGLWYGGSSEFCINVLAGDPGKLIEGHLYNATTQGTFVQSPQSKPFLAAFDPITGKHKWTLPTGVPNISSLMSTAGDLLFVTDVFGKFSALDAITGESLWSFNLGTQSSNPAVSYSVGGRQYVALATGGTPSSLPRIRDMWPDEARRMPPQSGGSVLLVFALHKEDE